MLVFDSQKNNQLQIIILESTVVMLYFEYCIYSSIAVPMNKLDIAVKTVFCMVCIGGRIRMPQPVIQKQKSFG